MSVAIFRFYEELNDFLPARRRKHGFEHAFERRASVKDMIEGLGVPHTEVELIVVNGASVNFSHIVENGDRIAVYPVFESLDITPLLRLRPQPLRNLLFVADANLGKLARLLRLLGLDTWYRNDYDDAVLAELVAHHRRVLLTRDRGLLKRARVTHGYFVRGTDPLLQAREVVARFDLGRAVKPFSRCTRCNGVIRAVDGDEVSARLPRGTRERHRNYWLCRECGRIYWEGSHHARLQHVVAQILR
jgi:uncharacterized protein with PIN domain/sulfur carrier protein ThiS